MFQSDCLSDVGTQSVKQRVRKQQMNGWGQIFTKIGQSWCRIGSTKEIAAAPNVQQGNNFEDVMFTSFILQFQKF